MGRMLRVILILVYVALTVFAIVHCANTPESKSRILPKVAWILVIAFLPFLGAGLWLILGSGTFDDGANSNRPRSAKGRPLAPDDDPKFLAKLDRENRARKRKRMSEQKGSERPTPPPAPTASESDVDWEALEREIRASMPESTDINPGKGPRDYTLRDYKRPEDRCTGDREDPEDDGARK